MREPSGNPSTSVFPRSSAGPAADVLDAGASRESSLPGVELLEESFSRKRIRGWIKRPLEMLLVLSTVDGGGVTASEAHRATPRGSDHATQQPQAPSCDALVPAPRHQDTDRL